MALYVLRNGPLKVWNTIFVEQFRFLSQIICSESAEQLSCKSNSFYGMGSGMISCFLSIHPLKGQFDVQKNKSTSLNQDEWPEPS